MNAAPSIPAKVRRVLYWVGYFLGVVVSAITSVTAIIAAASPTFSMPLELVIAQAVLTIVVSQLNLLSANNVTNEDAYADEIRAWDEAVRLESPSHTEGYGSRTEGVSRPQSGYPPSGTGESLRGSQIAPVTKDDIAISEHSHTEWCYDEDDRLICGG